MLNILTKIIFVFILSVWIFFIPLYRKSSPNKQSNAMQTTALRTVANSLPENEVILLTLLISKRYIPYTDLLKIFDIVGSSRSKTIITFSFLHISATDTPQKKTNSSRNMFFSSLFSFFLLLFQKFALPLYPHFTTALNQ